MSLEENHADLERHARDFAERAGFTYTVLAPDGDDVLGCVYIYPSRDERHDADVRSWVRADVAELDARAARGRQRAGWRTPGRSRRSTTRSSRSRPG